jgi:ABC-type dipeptide/oligopeptide/nickel transport system permease subunit
VTIDRTWKPLPLRLALGIVLCSIIVAVALFGPWLAPFEPTKMGVGPRLAPPSAAFPFGTDEFGRDLFSRVVAGARISLGIGTAAVVTGLVLGCLLGLIAAFSGRLVETILLRVVDVLYSFPEILLALALVAFLGPGAVNATIAVSVSLIPLFARVSHGLAAAERGKPYIEAASAAGIRYTRLVRVHVLPNIGQTLVAMTALSFSATILSVAGLSFLGLGVQPPSPEWGATLAAGSKYIAKAPWIMIFPGFAICFAALSLNLIGDGLRDISDPRWMPVP